MNSTFFSSPQEGGRAVDVGVLVDEDVGGHGVDQLDVVVELLRAPDAVGRAHGLAAQNGFGPEKCRDAGLDRIRSRGKHVPEGASVGGLQGQPAGPASGDADIAGQGGQDAAGPDNLFAIGPPLHPVSLVEDARFARAVIAGQPNDRVARYAADRFGPGRRLGDLVPRSQKVILVCLRPFRAGRHLRPVEAEAMGADEGGVVKALGDEDVGQGGHHGRVRAGAYGNPFVGQRDGAHGHARIDADDAGALLPGLAQEKLRVRAVAHLARVPAPHQDDLGVDPVLALVAGDARPVNGAGGGVHASPGVVVVGAERAAEEIQEPLGGLAAVGLIVRAGAVGDEEGRVAVRLFDPRQLAGHEVQGFVPGNAGESSLAPGARALQGIAQTVGVMLAAAVSAAARAGPELGRFDGIGRPVVAFDADDDAIPDVDLEQAAAAAVV